MASAPKRATVYFDPEIHRALRIKSAASDRSISDVVNEAVKRSLAEDADDLDTLDKRAKEPALDFGKVVSKRSPERVTGSGPCRESTRARPTHAHPRARSSPVTRAHTGSARG